MSDSKDQITERQREARRENGRKGKGPTTEKGKARSRQNAIRHGGYARVVHVIRDGPMKESAAEAEAFFEGVVADLDPGESEILRGLALDVAAAIWRSARTLRWEASAYTWPESVGDGIYEPSWHEHLAYRHRQAAETLRQLGDQNLEGPELWNCLSCVGFHPSVDRDEAWTKMHEDAKPPALLTALLQLINTHFESSEAAALVMEAKAAELETKAIKGRERDLPMAVRGELLKGVTQRLLRVSIDVNREVDRAFDRYWSQHERLRP